MTLLEIGEAIRSARKARGLTLQQVADDLGMGIATLSRLERGALNDIGLGRLLRVADHVGLELLARKAGFGMTLEDAMQAADRDFAQEAQRPTRQ